MIADSSQREEALDPSRSFIVEAPAGSGKTGLLVQRVLRLLSAVERPEVVVAMTFTRKAAAEMKERVVKALQSAHDSGPVKDEFEQRTRELALAALDQDSKKDWHLLADPGRLQVQTIDSLCALLTRQMPVLAGFGGFGEVVEDPRELYTLAAREMLIDLTEGSADDQALFHRMALHFDNNAATLENHLVKMLNKRDQWDHLSSENDSQLVSDFCHLLNRAGVCLLNVFERSGKVDFVEIARSARRALGQPDAPTDLLYSLDYRIQHLLVDEFQDTSRAQYNLVKALTEQWSQDDGHTLFLVGDPMQSIYGFREAEVSLFLRCWSERVLGNVLLTPVRLETNFRTTAPILDWVQTAFTPMMPEDNLHIGAVKFRPSRAGRVGTFEAPTIASFINDPGSAEADEVVKIIRQDKTSQSIAVLVRTRAHVLAILRALRQAGIAYQAIEIDYLKEQQHVIDLLSITRALVHLADRASWLACLRAPWCGLTLADLSALAEDDRERTIFDLLSDPEKIAQLSVDGRWRAVRLQEAFAVALEQLGRGSLRDLVEKTWLRLGGAAALTATHHREDANTFLDMLAGMEEAGTILDFSILNQKLDNLFARPSQQECRIQVMTIHQAKGLEFDAVIVPQLGGRPRSMEQELLVWTEEEGHLSIAALPQKKVDKAEYQRISDVKKQKEKEETARLFYVACTRAKNNLYLLGSATAKQSGLTAPSSGTFLKLLWPIVSAEFESAYSTRAPKQGGFFNLQNQGKTSICRLPLDWKTPASEPSIEWQSGVRRAAASDRPTTYEWVGASGRHTGTVVHTMLKRVAADSLPAWSVERVNSLAPVISSELLRLGVDPDECESASKQVIRAVASTLNSKRGRWIFGKRAEEYSEWGITGPRISGTVDRAFRDDDGRFWIVDFKNSDHKGAGLEQFLQNEKRRYSEQLENYAAIVSKMKTGPVWLGLYFPLLDSWLEWEYVAAAAVAS